MGPKHLQQKILPKPLCYVPGLSQPVPLLSGPTCSFPISAAVGGLLCPLPRRLPRPRRRVLGADRAKRAGQREHAGVRLQLHGVDAADYAQGKDTRL